MGNSIGKDKGEETVDGGQLIPHGVYKGPQDWNYRSVRKLIIERKLAPFYKGLSDYDESWNELTSTTHNLPEANTTFNGNSQGSSREAKRSALNTICTTKDKEIFPKPVEAQLYKGAVECPICFLYYPRNINHSRCCDQPICTECFVQIRRPANSSPAVCPFCVEPNFGVCYEPPSFNYTTSLNINNLIPSPPSFNSQDGKPRRKCVSYKNPDVVTTDQIRPDWATRVLQQHPHQLSNTRQSPNTSSSGNSRRIVIRPEGGGVTYVTSSTTSQRDNQPGEEYGRYLAPTDLEELMVMEAVRLSLLERDERERRGQEERDQTGRIQDDNSNNALSSDDGSTTGTITSRNLHNPSNSDGSGKARIDNNHVNIEDETELLESDDDNNEPTTVSTSMTVNAEDGILAPSSRGSEPSTPSSIANSTPLTNRNIVDPIIQVGQVGYKKIVTID